MSVFGTLKRLLIGAPIATSRAHHERLAIFFALAVFASDAISSVAYATEEILLVLKHGGPAALQYGTYIALAIAALVAVVIFSYIRTIYAYPQGGGGYRVSSDNLGSKAGRVAGAALLIDYVLTVAVSVSSGVLAIVSAFPTMQPYVVQMGLAAIGIMAIVNLRGTRESGSVFALPTYSFVLLMLVLILFGIVNAGRGGGEQAAVAQHAVGIQQTVGLWLLLRAFAAGCTALTGIEAIADGVAAFKPPEAPNASKTLISLGLILTTLFVGVSWMSHHYGIVPIQLGSENYRTVVAQLAALMFGEGALFYLLQLATMAILILAANTAFADFPRLSSFIARDSYLPRQLANVGDRLVFQNGIILLSLSAGLLIFFFKGDTHKLIPLYAVGVFTSFTLSQAGMLVRQVRVNAPFWGVAASFIGMSITGLVMIIILVTKFAHGAWLVVVTEAALLATFWGIRRHYEYLARELNPVPEDKVPTLQTTVLLLVPARVHRGILHAIAYAKTLSHDCRGVHITDNSVAAQSVKEAWAEHGGSSPLVILESPFRSILEPLMEYIDEAVKERPNHMLTVLVPQAVPKYFWQAALHNNLAPPIKRALAARKNVVVTNVRYFLE